MACNPQSKSLTSGLSPPVSLHTDQSHDIESAGQIQQRFLATFRESLLAEEVARNCTEFRGGSIPAASI